VSWGGQGACGWDCQPCPLGPAVSPGPALAPGASRRRQAGGERHDASWLHWRWVLTSALGLAQPCSELRPSSFHRLGEEEQGSLEMTRAVCRVAR